MFVFIGSVVDLIISFIGNPDTYNSFIIAPVIIFFITGVVNFFKLLVAGCFNG